MLTNTDLDMFEKREAVFKYQSGFLNIGLAHLSANELRLTTTKRCCQSSISYPTLSDFFFTYKM